MVSKYVRALALRVSYHIAQKLPDLHGQPTRTLVMMVSAFLAVGVLGWYAARFQIKEMFRDLKDRLNMDRHHLATEVSVGKKMLIVSLGYLVSWRTAPNGALGWIWGASRSRRPGGKLSVYRIAETCFNVTLPEAPDSVDELILSRWTNRRAVQRRFSGPIGTRVAWRRPFAARLAPTILSLLA